VNDNDDKNTGGKYRMIPIFERNPRMYIATKGVKTVLGTGAEAATYAHGTQGLEFVAPVKQRGMTPSQALQAGTINGVELLEWQDLSDRSRRASSPTSSPSPETRWQTFPRRNG
jgi:hypothetical protein